MSIQELEREREIILSEILSLFDKNITENKQIAAFLTKELQETVTQADMSGYAADIGECLSKAIESTFMNMSDLDNIPYRMADATISPAIREAYRRIMKKAASVQKTIDEKNGVGLNSVTPEYAKERVHDLIWTHTRIKDGKIPTKEEQLSKIKEPVVTCCQSFYDDFIKRNAKFRCDAGKTEYIIRISTAKCCEWWTSIAGKYNYEDVSDTGNNVFRRHQRCRCAVIFADGTGKRQDVHSKKEWMADPETLEERKTTGLEEPSAEVLEARKTAGLEEPSAEVLEARKTAGLEEPSPELLEVRRTAGLEKTSVEIPIVRESEDKIKLEDKTLDISIKSQYNRSEKVQYEVYQKNIENGEISPLVDFSHYRDICEEIEQKLIGTTTYNGITIESRSNHFVTRVIGSVEQRRNGVPVDTVLAIIKEPDVIDAIVIENGRQSQRFKKNNIGTVSVNPITKKLIQVNPIHNKEKR